MNSGRTTGLDRAGLPESTVIITHPPAAAPAGRPLLGSLLADEPGHALVAPRYGVGTTSPGTHPG